ncbi:MAG: tetratricopeptide repeat protein, partial [Methylotenera sp.]
IVEVIASDLLHSGLAHQQAGRLSEAEAIYRQVLLTDSQQPDALHLLGLIASQVKIYQLAAQLIEQAIDINPYNPFFYNNLGIAFKEQNLLLQAKENYQKALLLKPDYAQAYNNLGVVLKEHGDLTSAIINFKQALVIEPSYVEAHSNLGSCYSDQGELFLATECHKQAITLNPGYAPAYNNLGRVYEAEGQLDKAINCYRKAISLKPDYVELQHTLALLLLKLGEYKEGWRYYESRYHSERKNTNTVPPKLPFKQWQGESLIGKSILIWPEQGFGDEIQFCRYVPILKKMGAKFVTLVCKKPLKPLFETLAGVDQLLSNELNTIQHHDYWTFLLSIPLYCQTTHQVIPAYKHYLSALPDRIDLWRAKLPKAKFRVGLVWKGSSLHKNDLKRSIEHLKIFSSILNSTDITFISLQKGQGEDDVIGLPITHLGSDIQNFADTAAIVSQLDLVICVDTVIAHLAGALGKPAWVLLPFSADWRWLINREDSPWYAQLTLFRQNQPGNWGEVLERVQSKLLLLVNSKKKPPVADNLVVIPRN